ncbi:MAG TPA: PKD domain-containing protein, partial [Bacteroidetes bacterium]|nr:PKD domain-containing protein [Bacteroidota bacterium]
MHCYSQYISRILIVFLFFGGNLRAQDNLVIKGQEEIQRMNYGKAIEYFNASFRRAPSAASSEGKANAYLGLRDYKNAARWQEKALSFEGHSESLRFRYGKTLQMLGKQRAAALQFDTCAQSMPGNEQFLGMVNFSRAAVLSEPDTAWEVTALGINSSESDFGPVIWQEGLLFSSQRNNSVLGVTFSSQANGGFLADFYYAKAKDSLRFSRPGLLPRGINTVFHEGPACLMADSSGIYFARSRRVSARSQGDVATSDLWQATFSNEKWEAPQRLPFSEQAGTYSDPFLLPDGKTLLFSAEIPGGLGGLDLYQTTLSGDQWSSPQNLGPEINTSGNERSPFVHLNGELWFASDGHPGWGGLDIFHAHPLGHRWVSPQNPGLPLNSYQDDYDLIFAANGRLGYFVSNRIHGGWDDDVFAFSFQETREIICQVQKPNTYCYTLYEENTPDPLPATLLYQWQLGDGAKYFGGTIDHCFPGPGDYQVQLEVIDSLTGELVFRQASYLLKIRNEIQAYIEAPDYIQKGVAQVFSGEESYFPGFHPEQYLWNWGDGLTSKGKVVSHTYSAPGNYEIQLLIEGDALGEGLDYYCVTRMVTVTEGPVPKPKPKATLVPPKHSPNSGMHSQNQYRIQLGVSPSGLDSLADSYRNIPGVTIV